MAAFEYTAIDAKGRQRKGVVEGDSSRQVRQTLRDQGLAPMAVEPAASRGNGEAKPGGGLSLGLFAPTLSPLDLALLTRQLATLIAAGLPVEEALHAVARQTDKRRQSALVMNVRGKVLEGYSLAAALGEYPNAFSQMYRSTVAAGEHSGFLHVVLDNLANHTEARFESMRGVQMALIYPILLFCASVLIVSGLLVYVVPNLVSVFADAGQELPALTVALIDLSSFLTAYWWLLLGGICGFALLIRMLLSQPGIRLGWDRRKLSLPLIGKMGRGGNASRYANTLSILTTSGVPLVDAMQIATEVVANTYLKRRLGAALQSVKEGSSLRSALEQAGHFPPMFLHMVGSGEASGELDAMLAKVADYQQKELTRLVGTLVELLQPLMMLVMSGIVMLIMMAIMVPMLNMNQLVF